MPTEYVEMRDLGDEQPESTLPLCRGLQVTGRRVESPSIVTDLTEQLPGESRENVRDRLHIQ